MSFSERENLRRKVKGTNKRAKYQIYLSFSEPTNERAEIGACSSYPERGGGSRRQPDERASGERSLLHLSRARRRKPKVTPTWREWLPSLNILDSPLDFLIECRHCFTRSYASRRFSLPREIFFPPVGNIFSSRGNDFSHVWYAVNWSACKSACISEKFIQNKMYILGRHIGNLARRRHPCASSRLCLPRSRPGYSRWVLLLPSLSPILYRRQRLSGYAPQMEENMTSAACF